MYFIPDDALLRLRQMRKRKLQLGGRLTGHDARLRGDDDAVRDFWAKPYSYIILANQT